MTRNGKPTRRRSCLGRRIAAQSTIRLRRAACPRAARADLRDRRRPRCDCVPAGRPANRRRTTRPRAGWRRPGSRSRSTRPAISSAPARHRARPSPRFGRDPTWTRCPRAASSTARSASSPASRRSSGSAAAPHAGVVFRDEERGCVGSSAFVAGRCPARSSRRTSSKGRFLARRDSPLGVATGIVGYVRGEATVVGRAAHAGSTPMDIRDDALCRAAELVLGIRDAALGIEGAVATVGRLEVEPGGVNVVPARSRSRSMPARRTPCGSRH